MVECEQCGREVCRRSGRLYQRFCSAGGCRTAWWRRYRDEAIRLRDERKWGVERIARALSKMSQKERAARFLSKRPPRPVKERCLGELARKIFRNLEQRPARPKSERAVAARQLKGYAFTAASVRQLLGPPRKRGPKRRRAGTPTPARGR